jgi:hypothetical protein
MDTFRYFLRSRLGLAVSVVAAVAGAYLFATHTSHVLAAVPYLFLLACPLMHLFGHHHHGGSHGPEAGPSSESR